MSYTDDAVKAKLSSLNETQEGIVAVAQWVMFHRRYADKTVDLWMQRLKDSSSSKRLNLIYLANEVIQQSKARRRNEFVTAFSPIVAEAAAIAYKSATNDVQNKLRRVIEVWRQRQIFEPQVQDMIESRIGELDKSRPAGGKKTGLGGSLFSTSSNASAADLPSELAPLLPLQNAITKATVTSPPLLSAADTAYDTQFANPTQPNPTPPLHAARLSSLLKTLASAEGAVAEGIRARTSLISTLEKMLDDNRAQLARDEATRGALATKMEAVEAKKRDVEDNIMRGLSAEPGTAAAAVPAEADSSEPARSPPRPEVERLTPPPPQVEGLTPVGSPRIDAAEKLPANGHAEPTKQPGADLLSSLAMPQAVPMRRPLSSGEDGGVGAGSAKRRRLSGMDDESAVFGSGDALEGLDDDVAEMLGRD